MFLRKGFSIESKCVYIFQHFMWIHVFALLESNIKRKSINVSSMRSQNVGFRSFSLEIAIYLSLSLSLCLSSTEFYRNHFVNSEIHKRDSKSERDIYTSHRRYFPNQPRVYKSWQHVKLNWMVYFRKKRENILTVIFSVCTFSQTMEREKNQLYVFSMFRLWKITCIFHFKSFSRSNRVFYFSKTSVYILHGAHWSNAQFHLIYSSALCSMCACVRFRHSTSACGASVFSHSVWVGWKIDNDNTTHSHRLSVFTLYRPLCRAKINRSRAFGWYFIYFIPIHHTALSTIFLPMDGTHLT